LTTLGLANWMRRDWQKMDAVENIPDLLAVGREPVSEKSARALQNIA